MKKQLNEYWKEYLSEVYDYVIRPMTFHRGMIVADDESGEMIDSVKEILHVEMMKQRGKYHEITIDKNWPFNDNKLFRSNLFESAENANEGLLRINVTDIRAFDDFHCRLIKELAKREEINYDIYILLVIKDHSWKEVVDYAAKHSKGQFEDMMSQWYRRIEPWEFEK